MNNIERIYKENNEDIRGFMKNYASYLSELLAQLDVKTIELIVNELHDARKNNNTVFVIGNGGSAATASHIGNDFGLVVQKNDKNPEAVPFKVLPLTDNMSIVSAIGNDADYENIFVDQLRVHFRKGDKLLAISASGNSPNLVKAVDWVNKQDGVTMGWLGFDGGKLNDMVNIPLVIKTPKNEYAPVEDLHMILDHMIVSWLQYSIINPQ